ncbi:MAG: DUF3306 domain-containing protein [Neomegalonema sp.]|nr:DUF3306 domain-containing protein [Neomegalonema sp.]
MSDQEDGFVGRWARRKAAARRGNVEPQLTDAPLPDAPAAVAPSDEKTDSEILEELGLPAPEDIQPGDGVQGFMQAGVPDALRRRALRRIWSLNPELANLDALVEYGEDYTDAATVVANLQSAYEAGEGYKSLFAEFEKEERERAIAEAQSCEASEAPADVGEPAPARDREELASEPQVDAAIVAAPFEDAAPVVRAKRRMRFEFD